MCRSLGFFEGAHYSFMSPVDLDRLNLAEDDSRRNCVRLLNPLGEDYSLMRTTLIPAVLRAVAFNLNRKAAQVRLFEQNRIFIPQGDNTVLPEERDSLCMAIAAPEMDFFTFKGYVEAICQQLKLKNIHVLPGKAPYLHPGRSAVLMMGEVALGEFGQLHPSVAAAYDMDRPVYLAEVDLQTMMDNAGTETAVKPLPKYPATTRDLAVTVDKAQLIGPMMECIRTAGGDMLESVELFDVYEGQQVGQGKKSVAFSMAFRSAERTLVDDEVNKRFDRIVRRLGEAFGAQIRQ